MYTSSLYPICIPQSNMIFLPPMVTRIQLRPTSENKLVKLSFLWRSISSLLIHFQSDQLVSFDSIHGWFWTKPVWFNLVGQFQPRSVLIQSELNRPVSFICDQSVLNLTGPFWIRMISLVLVHLIQPGLKLICSVTKKAIKINSNCLDWNQQTN